MDDPFYNPASHEAAHPGLWETILSAPPGFLVTVVFAPLLLLLFTRVLSERSNVEDIEDEELPPALQSYWFPSVGRGISILRNSHGGLRNRGRDLFALDMGSIIKIKESSSNTVESENSLNTAPRINSATWNAASKFFGLSAKPKYDKVLEQLLQVQQKHLSGTYLHTLTIQNLERNIPQMISFIDSPIDLQPWEKLASPIFLSHTNMEINLFSLLQHMLGHASIPAVFGPGLLEKYPFLLQDFHAMDEGMEFFLLGLPAVIPWHGVFTAHMARRRVWEAMDRQQKVLDGLARGEEEEEDGDLGDVSEFVLERNKLWRDNGFTVKERGDICLLYALTTSPSHQIYNLTLAIISTPSLLTRILAEIKPHVKLTEGLTIGKHSSLPSLTISTDALTKKCPLLRSAYLETLKLSGIKQEVGVGERFKADRFMNVESKDRESAGFLEKECLALVAGVLTMWEFEPVEGEVWGDFGMGGIGRGGEGKRVRVKRRKIEWDI